MQSENFEVKMMPLSFQDHEAMNLRLLTSNFKFLTSDFRLPTSDFQLEPMNQQPLLPTTMLQ